MDTGLAGTSNDTFCVGTELRACGIFYRLSASHYLLPTCDIPADTKMVKGEPLPLTGMFNVWFALNAQGEKIGFIASSSFVVLDKGGVLIAALNKGKGRASAVEVLLKTKEIIIYHFPNRGTMIVNPQMGEAMSVILEEQ